MPFDSNGNSSLTRQRAVTGQIVLADQVNVPFDDAQAMFNQTFLRSGIAPMTGPLNVNGFKITNLDEGVASTDAVNVSQLNAITATLVSQLLPTGMRGSFFMSSAPIGWIKGNGGTIGNALSGATNRANDDTKSLFTLFWTQFTNAVLPIQTSAGAASTRGASADADWAANKRLTVFDLRNDYDRAADDGKAVDATNIVGLHVEDTIKSHTISGATDVAGNANPTVKALASATAVTSSINTQFLTLDGTGVGGQFAGPLQSQAHQHTATLNYAGGTETKPKTTTTLHCIKL